MQIFFPKSPFLQSPETFQTHLGWRTSLCIFKTKARNFAGVLAFIPFTTYQKKKSFTELAGRSFPNGFWDPKSFWDFRETGSLLDVMPNLFI